MPDPADFDTRLSAALERYAERAPVAPDLLDVAETAMGSGAPIARRWAFPNLRSAPFILLLGLLLVALFAVASGAGGRLFQRDRLAETVATPSPSASPTPSPSGPEIRAGEAWIAYMATDSGRLIGVVRPDGTGRHTLFPFVPGGEQQHPDWSPDGMRLVFTVVGSTEQGIWIGDADGSNTALLAGCQSPCQWVDEPAWSPDGRSVAFQRMVSNGNAGVSTLEILDLATRQTRVLFTAEVGHAIFAPRWSGDGTRLVFENATLATPASDAEVTGSALTVLDVSAGSPTPRQITQPDVRCTNPDWSWVNDLIVCTKPTAAAGFDGPADLYTIQPDGTAFAPLTAIAAAGGEAIKPTWLPNGSGVIFCDSSGVMRTILANGTGLAPAMSGQAVTGLHPRVRPTP